MQTLSGQIARKFNKQVPGASLRFLPTWIIRIDDGEFALVEPYMAGDDFVKYNDNNGEVLDQDPVMQAFSHFSWQNSGGSMLICDLQGWGQILTDPQIHTIDGKGFGQGNMGEDGIQNFFDSHRCNHCCRSLGLVDGGKSHPLTNQTEESLTTQKEEGSTSRDKWLLRPASACKDGATAEDVLPANAQAKSPSLWSMLRAVAKSASSPFSATPDSSRASSPLASRGPSRTSSSCSGNTKRVLASPPPRQNESWTTARSRRQSEESSKSAEDIFAQPRPERRPSIWRVPSAEDIFAQSRKEQRPSMLKAPSAGDILAPRRPERKPSLWRVSPSGNVAREHALAPSTLRREETL
eukprot:Tamp_08692.p1 GENE.Tamp_08692~~Tamp_08692.p1  ORF type:complete len:352 (+),score=39.24 Tamp_08692:820-1875(+)